MNFKAATTAALILSVLGTASFARGSEGHSETRPDVPAVVLNFSTQDVAPELFVDHRSVAEVVSSERGIKLAGNPNNAEGPFTR